MGVEHPKQACYILCSPECVQFAKDEKLEDQTEHVSTAFDRCTTDATAKAGEVKDVSIDEVIKEYVPPPAAAQSFQVGMGTDVADTIQEAARFTAGISDKRGTRNKNVSYAQQKTYQKSLGKDFFDVES